VSGQHLSPNADFIALESDLPNSIELGIPDDGMEDESATADKN